MAQPYMEPSHGPGAAHKPRRNNTFHAAREPGRHEAGLQLEHDGASGPLPFLNPTRAQYRHEARPDVRFKWTSRNDRKGRHAVAIVGKQAASWSEQTAPRPTSSFRTVARNIWRMLTYYPVWDISFDVAFVFTLGSVIWVINAFFVYLPLVQPGTEFKNEELYGGGITAFIGATVFDIGSFLLIAEAVNEGRSGCFGWVVEQALSHDGEEVGGMSIRPSKSRCAHPHAKRHGNRTGHTKAPKHEQQPGQRSWVWWPSNEELRTHYIHNLGFLASLAQLLGASIFWVAGLTALPGIYNNMSKTVAIIFYWTPQVVGGLGFIISGSLFMLETQSKWWKPAPRTLGWWVGAWNLVGGIGFTICPAFGYDSSSWAQYQSCLSTFWGSWAFLTGSALQWYESLEKFPVQVNGSSNSGGDLVQVHAKKAQSTLTTAAREEALQLCQKEELPSIPSHHDLSVASSSNSSAGLNIVDWQGEDDAANPRNFPPWRKTINMACIFYLSVVSPFTSSVVAPAMPDIMIEFASTDAYLSAFVLSVYVLGYAFGPLLISPLSEQYGRLPLYHAGNMIFTVCTLACGYANSLGMLAALRFIAGLGASNVLALGPSSLADLVAKEGRGQGMALIGIAITLGPAVSPTAGSYLNASHGWRWIFYLTALLSGAGTLLCMVCMSETYEPVLLRRKAAFLREQTGNKKLQAKLDAETGSSKLKAFCNAMVMPFTMLLFSGPIFFTSLLTAIGYGYLYILYTTLPNTFLDMYHWAPKKLGLAYLGIAVGNLLGMLGGSAVSDSLVRRRARKGDMRPELRLHPMIFWWPLVSIGLFVYAWTAQHAVHWIAPLLGTAIFGAGAMSSIFFTGNYILDAYPLHSASGMAACSVMRSLVGGLAPLFSHKMYQHMGVGWSFSLLALIALAFAPVPLVFYRFGEGWRGKERYGRRVESKAVSLGLPNNATADDMPRRQATTERSPLSATRSAEDVGDGEDHVSTLDPNLQEIIDEVTKGLMQDVVNELTKGLVRKMVDQGTEEDVQTNAEDITQGITKEMMDYTTEDTSGIVIDDANEGPTEVHSDHVTEGDIIGITLADSNPKTTSQPPPGYRSAAGPQKTTPHTPGTLYVKVGATESTQQGWSLPKTLLCQHSSYFDSMISRSGTTIDKMTFYEFAPRNFANFIHYMRSGIYSAALAPGDSALRPHIEACLLGAYLGAPRYCEAAIRALYNLLEPAARFEASSAAISQIQADDMAFVCKQADVSLIPLNVKNTEGHIGGLRCLFFDALAAHWMQRDVLGLIKLDNMDDEVLRPRGEAGNPRLVLRSAWLTIYRSVPDFRIAIRETRSWDDAERGKILKDVDMYLGMEGEWDDLEQSSDTAMEGESSDTLREAEDFTDDKEKGVDGEKIVGSASGDDDYDIISTVKQ
ncbi:integral membrane [Pyrenophora seminiperda CCB06]|uniref:Integral membrane n=1 Tax=Pyrenophora seminiperda CCB06 TaxID=1302712 RepID=A0A3M7MB24_9PLEO|nr:integral membrane [Pyrenophora seminiperda CCB06]